MMPVWTGEGVADGLDPPVVVVGVVELSGVPALVPSFPPRCCPLALVEPDGGGDGS